MTLRDEFRHRGELRGGTLLMTAQDASAMVERARELGIRVLGVDGFRITETTTRQVPADILDLGSTGEGWDDAARFIAERAAAGMRFEVTADE